MALINGTVGNDELFGTGGPDTINGLEGDDTLRGNAGNDTLIGGLGNDQLDGGGGADSMYGGVGNDTYYIDSLGDQAVEIVADAAGGVDLVRSTISYTLGSGIENLALSDIFSINGAGNELNNTLYGNGGSNVLEGRAGNDVLYGAGGHDTILGGSGNDVLSGQSGGDQLDGGAGADRMYGGADHDRYFVDNLGDQTVEDTADALGGIDHVLASVTHTLGFGIEHLSLTGSAAINGTGNGKENFIIGNVANNVLSGLDGKDQLYGNAGNDTLHGGNGNDDLNGDLGNDLLNGGTGADLMGGGSGNDTYVVDNFGDQAIERTADALGGVDTVQASVTHALGFGIEHLTLTGSATINGIGNATHNTIIGNSANNVLSGLDGNDVLTGGAGNDTLNGGNGNDVLTGGSGRDQLNGGAGNDRFDYNAVSESPTSTGRDVITGFAGAGTALGDQIDLRDIDANTLVAGNQAFQWKGATPGGAGTLWYSGGVLYGNVDGDATPEFQIQLLGTPALSVGGAGTDILL